MSDMNIAIVNDAMHRVLRVSSALTYGSLVIPYDENVQWPSVRARRVPALKQWPIERENFESSVVQGYADMEDGAVRQLVAGTGVGKSTVLPYTIASQMGVSGLILMPNNTLPVANMPYLTTKFREWGNVVRPVILRTRHGEHPEPGPTIYMSSAVDFLSRLAKRPSLLQDLGVGFIYLDESHVMRPEYTFFRYAKEAGILGSVKVFYGTATAANDLNMESGGVGRSVSARPVNMFPMSAPAMTPPASPMYFANIQDRTMIFVSTDSEAIAWAEYYDEHDIAVMAYLTEEGDRQLAEVPRFLHTNRLCVLLVPASFQTGFTFDLDTVICTGHVAECRMDPDNARMELRRRPVTQAERTQRMGRVGRFKPGRGFYSDIEPTPICANDTEEVSMYVFLWSKVFNMTINEPAIKAFQQLTGEITAKAAAILLHARIHPYLLLPYVANDGFYEHWGKVMKYTLYSSIPIEGEQSNVDRVQSWREVSTGPVDYAPAPIRYRCAVQFPREWTIIPAMAWLSYNRVENMENLNGLGTRSVISAVTSRTVTPQRTRRSVQVVSPRQSVATTDTTQPPEYRSRERMVSPPPSFTSRSRRSGSESVPSIRQLQEAYSVYDTPPRMSQPPRDVQPTPPSPSERVQDWQRNVPPSPTLRRVSGSESSNERNDISLRQVSPEKFMYHKLYPMDTETFETFIENEMVEKADHKRVRALLEGRRDFSSLPDDATSIRSRQQTYFISVLKVHNSALSRKLQLTANYRTGFLSKTIMRVEGSVAVEEADIRSTVQLLKTCALQRFYVGVDERTLHASYASSVMTPDYAQYESYARIMLAFGADSVRDIVRDLRWLATPVMNGDVCVGNCWRISRFIIATAHTIDEDRVETWPSGAVSVHATDWEHDIVVFESDTSTASPYMRPAKQGESVYVLMYSADERKVIIVGDYTITDIGYPDVMDFVLTHGCSGALVVSTDDGAIVGIYRGEYSTGRSWIIPIDFVKQIVYS